MFDCSPLAQFETYHGQGEKEHHGSSGPINISKGTHTCTRAENAFIDAADQLGYHELKDLQNLDANNGTERWMKYIGPDGRRQDSAHRFLHPKLQSGSEYPNLHVLCEKQVIRVLFDGQKRAVGVEYQSTYTVGYTPFAYTDFNVEMVSGAAVFAGGSRVTATFVGVLISPHVRRLLMLLSKPQVPA